MKRRTTLLACFLAASGVAWARRFASIRASELAASAGTQERGPVFIERIYRLVARMPDRLLLLIAGAGHRVMEARHLRRIKLLAESVAA